MADKVYARPIVPLLIALIFGIVLGSRLPGFEIGACGIIFLVSGWILLCIIREKAVLLSPMILFFILGYLSIQPWMTPKFPSNHIIHYLDTGPWHVKGFIDSRPQEFDDRKKFILQLESLTKNSNPIAVSGKIRVTAAGDAPDFSRGDRVGFSSRIRSIRNFKNPGGFDYRRYMAFRGVWATAYVQGSNVEILKGQPAGGFYQMTEKMRRSIADLIDRAGPDPQRGLLKALVIGDRSRILSETREAFNRSGTGHLLAISGLHIGIVATVAFVFFHWLLRYIKPLLWHAWTAKAAAILSMIPVCFYGLISGLSTSTQRAVIMVLVFLMTYLFEREHDPLNTLALAAMLILVVQPASLFSISFQLSFMAVLSILYGLSRVFYRSGHDIREDGKSRIQLRRKLYAYFLVSFFAIGGTLPLVMFYFNQISTVGLLANFVIVPIVGFMVVPVGLLALFVYPLSMQAASWGMQLAAFLLEMALVIVDFFATLPFAAVKTVTPSLFEMICFYAMAWAMLNLKATTDFQAEQAFNEFDDLPPEAPKSCQRAKPLKTLNLLNFVRWCRWYVQKTVSRRKIAVSVLVLVIVAGIGDIGYWLYQRFWRPDLRVTILDVGQGSAALLELPGGQTLLIDGGGFSDNAVFDIGARVLAPFLWRKKIRTIDSLVLSHPNSDHLNGLIYIADHFNVKRVWTNNEVKMTLGYQNFMKVIAKRNIRQSRFESMRRSYAVDGVGLQFLYPPADFLNRGATDPWRNTNNNSLVVRVSFGSTSFLFPGDIMFDAENELIRAADNQLASTVLVAPHHGSRSSSSPELLEATHPQVVVISCGWKNRFGLPHPEVIKRYRDLGCNIFRTDINGAICLTTDGRNLSIKPFVAHSKAVADN